MTAAALAEDVSRDDSEENETGLEQSGRAVRKPTAYIRGARYFRLKMLPDDNMEQPMFRCDALCATLTMPACAARWHMHNRRPQAQKEVDVGVGSPCRGCKLGRKHAVREKARTNG